VGQVMLKKFSFPLKFKDANLVLLQYILFIQNDSQKILKKD